MKAPGNDLVASREVEECSRLVTRQDAGSARRLVEALADEVLRDPEVVSLATPPPAEAPESLRRRDQMAQFERHRAVRFATTGTLRREASVLEAAAEGVGAGVAVSPTRSSRPCSPVTCSPAAPSGRTRPRRCEGSSRVASRSPSSSHRSGRASPGPSRRHGVVGLGPGMARTDDLARLVEAVNVARPMLVLVGDPHQVGAVGPGGLFRTLVDVRGGYELETVRRFGHAWGTRRRFACAPGTPRSSPPTYANDRIQRAVAPP